MIAADGSSAHTALLLGHLVACSYMAGVIWFVQRVHYPLFGRVGRQGFPAYQTEHVRRTGPVVGPMMLVEAATALGLLATPPPGVPVWLPATGAGMLLAIWLSTGLLQVPRHRELADGFDERAHRRLVGTNWIRAVLWSLRAGIALAMVVVAGSGAAPATG